MVDEMPPQRWVYGWICPQRWVSSEMPPQRCLLRDGSMVDEMPPQRWVSSEMGLLRDGSMVGFVLRDGSQQ